MNVLIVEDEPVIVERLKRQLKQLLGAKLNKLYCLDNLDDAQEFLTEHQIDLLLLDLNLHGANGFELLQTVAAASYHTIIVSAYADKAIDAFAYGVLDFIAKPFTLERLNIAIQRLLDVSLRQDYGARYLSIKQAGSISLLEVKNIEYVEAAGHYSEVVCAGEKRLHDKSIEKLLAILPPNFERIHRSYIVNMNKVSRLLNEAGSKYSLKLNNGIVLPVGRTRIAALRNKLKGGAAD